MDEFDITEWKLLINNFLWSHLPTDTTLAEAETVACEVLECIDMFYDRRKNERFENSNRIESKSDV